MGLQSAVSVILGLLKAIQECGSVDDLSPLVKGRISALLGPAYIAPGTSLAKIAGALMLLLKQKIDALHGLEKEEAILALKDKIEDARVVYEQILEADDKRRGNVDRAKAQSEPESSEEDNSEPPSVK